ncbi:MAG: hypothetical protein COW00_03825 [Bdellovibrio sp. CG12_big_fil_rev_8_21_14_0_65_39_13]|nr:MAG: hypothetical protein COW78_14610 [Bdellovibrio sp. CG22_combo_CG10-13_8_21_14_all_39_27]PIQ61489.1 MAG: hypothetical protein COW00_03825 [Bdellovibrio sp. CG12_big_fil_rev_8_21_14_0_65_39_13]
MKPLFLFLLLTTHSTFAFAEDGVAKAILLKGDVSAVFQGKTFQVKQGDWLKEGAQVKTQPKSFAKFLFVDKSSMNLGPNSEMKIDTFPKNDAGIVTLIKGQLRSKVTKNYMDMDSKDKSKLFIKTKSAAMGVRGTDFQVNYNPENNATALVTFEGRVAMAQLDRMDDIRKSVSQNSLERLVSSPEAVMVTKGQFSGVSGATSQATVPVKINPVQLETMQKQEVPMTKEDAKEMGLSKDQASNKTFRNVVPPGLTGKAVSTDSKDVASKVATGAGLSQKNLAPLQNGKAQLSNTPPPEGSINLATGKIAPTAGGFIDVGTAQYIPPPPGSAFDANTQTYIPPTSVGSVDPTTGDFFNPNFKLASNGTFVPVENITDGRAPASTAPGVPGTTDALLPPPPPPVAGLAPTISTDGMASGYIDPNTGVFVQTSSGLLPPPPIDPALADTLTDGVLLDNQQSLNDSLNNPIQTNSSRVQFNFNAQ